MHRVSHGALGRLVARSVRSSMDATKSRRVRLETNSARKTFSSITCATPESVIQRLQPFPLSQRALYLIGIRVFCLFLERGKGTPPLLL